MLPSGNIVDIEILTLHRASKLAAVAAGCHAHVFCILRFRDIISLQDFPIVEDLIRIAKRRAVDRLLSRHNRPEIIVAALRICRIGRHSDMLCRIITESVCAARDQIIQIVQKIFLKIRILCIDIRQSAHLSRRTLITVSPVYNRIEAIGMEQVVLSSDRIVQIL